jgi:hypothetical protein
MTDVDNKPVPIEPFRLRFLDDYTHAPYRRRPLYISALALFVYLPFSALLIALVAAVSFAEALHQRTPDNYRTFVGYMRVAMLFEKVGKTFDYYFPEPPW